MYAAQVHSTTSFSIILCITTRDTMKKDKRAKFIELGEKRMANAIKSLRLIGNLADKNNYHYTQEDAAEIAKALKHELNDTLAKFKSSGSSLEGSGFKFSQRK